MIREEELKDYLGCKKKLKSASEGRSGSAVAFMLLGSTLISRMLNHERGPTAAIADGGFFVLVILSAIGTVYFRRRESRAEDELDEIFEKLYSEPSTK